MTPFDGDRHHLQSWHSLIKAVVPQDGTETILAPFKSGTRGGIGTFLNNRHDHWLD